MNFTSSPKFQQKLKGVMSFCAMFSALMLPAGLAHAAGQGGGNPWLDLLWKFINFFILVGLLFYFGKKPIANLFRNAAVKNREEMDESLQGAKTAQQELAGQQQKIENLELELKRLREEALEEARTESERIISEARAQGERIISQMRLQVEQEFNKARTGLKRDLAAETIRLAEENIRGQLDDGLRRKLADSTMEQMGGSQ